MIFDSIEDLKKEKDIRRLELILFVKSLIDWEVSY